MPEEEANTIKLFKTLLILIPCLFITVLVIIAMPEKNKYVIDLEGDLDAFDEPTYVTNSEMSFFYKNDQLSTYREQQKADKGSYFSMSDSMVTTDFTKNEVQILPDIDKTYTGSLKMVIYKGEPVEYIGKTENEYTLKGGSRVPVTEAFEIILSTEILGKTESTPHIITKGNTYYCAFTTESESIYFAFESGNEFVSVILGGLTKNISYTLLDENLKPIKNGVSQTKSEIEIQHKGKGSARYYLKVTGSYSENLKPFSIKLPSDNNEWMWQMAYEDINKDITGTFDYYGDEDFFVLPAEVTENINKSVMRFTNANSQINVVIYDVDRNIVGQHVLDPSKTDTVSMYGVKNAYAVSLYSYDGTASGQTYTFRFEHTEITVLDIETFGFSLSPKFSNEEDYYIASISSIKEKRITDVMYSTKDAEVVITVEQQCGYKTVTSLGKDLELGLGRNTVTLTIKANGISRDITIVISDKTYDLSYGYMVQGYDGLAVKTKALIISHDDSKAKTQIQLCEGKNIGQYKWVPDSSIFTGLKETTMPSEYKNAIEALREKYPNWKFTFVKTGISLEDYVKTQLGENSIIQKDGTWMRATEGEIEYYVNPVNFLNEKYIFMFEKQTYNEESYTTQGIKSIWNNDTYVSYISDAAVSTGLSPYFIAARAGLESGFGSSKLASGTVSGYEGYYNFYGINAVDSNPANGAKYAMENNWNTKRKAIIEGAAWVKSQYISCQQNTIYFMKYSFVPNRAWHQYMTDIAAPSKDASNYYTAHCAGGSISGTHEFIIPVFSK